MQVNGYIKTIKDTEIVSEKFKKREFVLEIDYHTPYPQTILFVVCQERCSMLDQYKPEDYVSVDFNLRGWEWNGPEGTKYFNTLDAWKLERVNNYKGK